MGSTEEEGLHILMVDDHEDTITVLRTVLRKRGFRVTTAATIAQALSVGDDFDVLLCDIQLPDGTGHELLERLREEKAFPAIAMSGFGMAADIETSLAAGFCVHLIKPFTTRQLNDAIMRALDG